MMAEIKKYQNIDALRTFWCLAIIAWHVKANTNFNTCSGIFIDTRQNLPIRHNCAENTAAIFCDYLCSIGRKK